MSIKETEAALCAPGARFEMETRDIRGVATRTWKNSPKTLAELVAIGRGHGARLFTIYEDERVTFDAWHRATAALALELQRLGVRKGDRVALAMRNLPEWPVAFFAATTIGAIVVPLNAWWTGQELSYGLSNSGAKVLICDVERWERIGAHKAELPDLTHVLVNRAEGALAAPARKLEDVIGAPMSWASLPDTAIPVVALDPEDDATIFYTSGTTGNPKGALGTHRNITTNIFSSAYSAARACLRRGDTPPAPTPKVGLTVIPLFHVTACSAGMMTAVFAGNTTIFMRKWDTIQAFEIIQRERVNSTGGVPTIAWQMIEHPDRHKYDLSSLEAIAYGGAPSTSTRRILPSRLCGSCARSCGS